MKNIGKLLVFCFVVLFIAVGARNALCAGKYPEKPINVIIACDVGCGADILSRMMAKSFEKHNLLPQPLVVENKPGGASAIANAYVAGKTKDPYYILATASSFMTTPLLGGTPIDYRNFTILGSLANDYGLLLVPSNSKYKSLGDFIADAKANPRKLSVGISSAGAGQGIGCYLIQKMAGIQLNPVALGSGGQIMVALLGSHVDAGMSEPGECLELYRAGKVRVLAAIAEKRLTGFPDVPTMKEQGVNAVMSMPRGFVAPGDIPADARKVLEEALYKYAKSEDFKAFCKENQLEEAWMDGTAFKKWIEKEATFYVEAHRAMGIAPKK